MTLFLLSRENTQRNGVKKKTSRLHKDIERNTRLHVGNVRTRMYECRKRSLKIRLDVSDGQAWSG